MIIILGGTTDAWGFIPSFLDVNDPRPAAEQFNANYISGWTPFDGFKFNAELRLLAYLGDPAVREISSMIFRNERIHLFPSAWVVIEQPDDSWAVSRMD